MGCGHSCRAGAEVGAGPACPCAPIERELPAGFGRIGGPRPKGRVPGRARIRWNRLELKWPSHNKALKLTRLAGG